MELVLAPGDKLRVTLKDSDGEFELTWDKKAVRIHSDLADSTGRCGIIYEEVFRKPDPREKSVAKANTKLLPTRNAVQAYLDFAGASAFLGRLADICGAFGNSPGGKDLSEAPANSILILSKSRIQMGLLASASHFYVKSGRHWWPQPETEPHNGWSPLEVINYIQKNDFSWGLYRPR